ncbi:MAG: DUF58 domain-containing protein [Campylobacterota bacterium]|nr:DUF58 domain-containing protein [Campylobacterota bacterium]
MHPHTSFRALQIKARHQVYTLLSGNNLSKLHGEGYDLSELREYQIGDDIRKINWTITAKLGKPYVKELHANRELSVVVTAMMGGSLYFGEGKAKQDTLTEVAALLGYAAQQNADLFTGICYQADKTTFTPPTKQLYHIEAFSKNLYECDTLSTTLDYNEAIKDLFVRIRKPSLIFIIGDFLQEADFSLLAQKHEVIALIIRDRLEEEPHKMGEVILNNPQDNIEMNTYFGKKSIDRYLTKLRENDEALIGHFSRYDIRYTKIYTDEEAVGKLIGLFR